MSEENKKTAPKPKGTATAKRTGTKKPVTKAKTATTKTVSAKTAAKQPSKKTIESKGLASAALKNQAADNVANINKTTSKASTAKKQPIKASKSIPVQDDDKTVTVFEEVAAPKPKKFDPNVYSEVLNKQNGDATVTAGLGVDISISDKDKEIAQQMVEEHRVLSSRFQLEDIIGIGGMGIVYRATDTIRQAVKPNDCSVAIKVLGQDVRKYKQAFLALQREAYKEQQLSHPNVIKVFDFNRCEDAVYKVMELIDGIHLKDWLKDNRNKGNAKVDCDKYTDQVEHIINEVAKGLEYVHGQGIVHSDLKPSNIFVTNAGEIKVFDFGIARTIKTTNFNQKDPDVSIFDPTTFAAFTPKYASYEMLTRQEPSPADDVYALGCIMYEMLAGHHPYDGKNAKDAYEREMVADSLENVPEHIETLVMSMIELKKENRTPNMTKVLEVLNQQYLPAMGGFQNSSTAYTVDTNSIITNKPFILTVSLLLGIANLYGLSTWFKPNSETYVITDPQEVQETASGAITGDNARQVLGTTPGCESIIASDNPQGEKCLLSLKTDDGSVYRLNMMVFKGESGNYAISKEPLNNITVSSLGERLSKEDKNSPLAVHTFTKQSLQTFYIRTISLYGSIGLASPEQITTLSDNGERICGDANPTPSNLTFMDKSYGEAVLKGGSSFDVLSVDDEAGKCSLVTSSLSDYAGKDIVTRLVWKPVS